MTKTTIKMLDRRSELKAAGLKTLPEIQEYMQLNKDIAVRLETEAPELGAAAQLKKNEEQAKKNVDALLTYLRERTA